MNFTNFLCNMLGQRDSKIKAEEIAVESIKESRENYLSKKSLPHYKTKHLAQQLTIIHVQVILRHHLRLIKNPLRIYKVSHRRQEPAKKVALEALRAVKVKAIR